MTIKPKKKPVVRENLALKQVNQMLQDVSNKEIKSSIKAELNKLSKSAIENSVGIPKKRPKENVDSFAKRLLLTLRRIKPGQEKRTAAEKPYVTGLPDSFKKAKGGLVKKKINKGGMPKKSHAKPGSYSKAYMKGGMAKKKK